jgi:hypothetical protein
MAADTVRITLDFQRYEEPIEGRLWSDGCDERTFTGYMQLVTVLEAALGEARQAGGDSSEQDGGRLP